MADPKYIEALERAIKASLTPANQGCGVHVCAVLGFDAHGTPEIKAYRLDSFYDGSTVATIVNGSVIGR